MKSHDPHCTCNDCIADHARRLGDPIAGAGRARADRSWTYETNCIGSDGQSIQTMIDGASDISRSTFLRYVDRGSLEAIEQSIGYASSSSRNGELRMAGDWHVSYHRSTYRGRPCVYFRWSAIEHIFTGRN